MVNRISTAPLLFLMCAVSGMGCVLSSRPVSEIRNQCMYIALTMPPFQQLHLALAGVLLVISSGVDGFAVSVRLGRSSSSRFSLPYSTKGGVSLGAAAGEASSSAAAIEAAEGGQTGDEEDLPQALIFDCDGVLADTERDGHRPAFNAAFKIKNLGKSTRTSGRMYACIHAR